MKLFILKCLKIRPAVRNNNIVFSIKIIVCILKILIERIFDLSVDNEELVWHRDRRTRFVKVLEGVGWKFQFDNELPKEIGPGSTIHINKRCYHRLIKGSTPLKVRIVEL